LLQPLNLVNLTKLSSTIKRTCITEPTTTN
jgi:hypothetical protein